MMECGKNVCRPERRRCRGRDRGFARGMCCKERRILQHRMSTVLVNGHKSYSDYDDP